MRDRRFKRPMEAGNVVGDRVGLLGVAGRGVGEAQRVEWDVGMLRRAGRGGRMAEAVGG